MPKTDHLPRGVIDQLSRDNIQNLNENDKRLLKMLQLQHERIATMERNYASLLGEVQNLKQTIVFLQGNGLNTTDKKEVERVEGKNDSESRKNLRLAQGK